MMTDKTRDAVAHIIQTYGVTRQLNQVNEELAELIVEVAKNIRGFQNTDAIVEEMADVLQCFEYLKMILNISDEQLEIIKKHKLQRTLERMKSGYDVGKVKR